MRVQITSTHEGLGPFELSLEHPEWSIGLRASPLDEKGETLSPGWVTLAMPGYARWKMHEGYERVVRVVAIIPEYEGVGVSRPGDEIFLAPVGIGACTIEVGYFDARTEVTVSVRSGH